MIEGPTQLLSLIWAMATTLYGRDKVDWNLVS